MPGPKTTAQTKSLLTVTQAAKILKVSPDTLRNWERSGKLVPSRTAGGARRYQLSVIQELVTEKAPQVTPKKKGMLSISKAAKELGVSTDTLRNWEKKGQISAERTDGGARRYSKAQLTFLKKELGLDSKQVQIVQPIVSNDLLNTIGNASVPPANEAKTSQTLTQKAKTFSHSTFTLFRIALPLILLFLVALPAAFFGFSANNNNDQNLEKKVYDLAGNIEQLQNTLFNITSEDGAAKTLPKSAKNILGVSSIASLGKFLEFNADVAFNGTIAVDGEGIFTGNITAPNVVYGLVAGANVTISGDPQNPVISANALSSTETLASVTARGASTTTPVELNGGVKIGDLLSIAQLDSDPTQAQNGSIYYNTGSNKYRCYTNGGWTDCDTDTDTDTIQEIPEFSGDITSIAVGDGLTGGAQEGDVSLALVIPTAGTSANTASNSGLELGTGGLSLLRGCSNNQSLVWNSVTEQWTCGALNAEITVKEDGATITANASVTDYLGSDFNVSEAPAGEVNISIDYPNSGITRRNVAETVTADWTFSGDNLFSGNNTFSGTNITSGSWNNSGLFTFSSATPLAFSSLSPSISIANTGVLTITDGTNTLLSLSDNGTAGTLNINTLTASIISGYTLAGNIVGSGSPTLSGLGTINGATISGGSLSGGMLSGGTYTATGATVAGNYTVTIGNGNSFNISDGINTIFSIADAGNVGNLSNIGTISTTGAITQAGQTLDNTYVNVNESPSTGDISGSFQAGLTINNDSVGLGTDTTGDYVATITGGNGLTGSGTGEGSTPVIQVGAGTGISVGADDVSVDQSYGFNFTGNVAFTPSGSSDLTITTDNDSALVIAGLLPGTATAGLCIDASNNVITCVAATGDITAVGSITNGAAFADATADDQWLGLGASAGRIEFDDQTTDEINFLSANIGIGTSTPASLLSVGSSSQFQVNSAGAIAAATGITSTGAIALTPGGTNDILLTVNNEGGSFLTLAGLSSGTAANAVCLDASNNVITCAYGAGSGDITAVGDATTGDAFTNGGTGNSLFFNNNSNVGELTAANLTGSQTYTLPDASGEISLLGQSVSNAELDNSSITINTAGPLSGGGTVALGGSLNLTCTTCVTSSTTLFTLAASSGSDSTISFGDTVTIAAGSGISTTGDGSGSMTIANTGVLSITGTANQVTASASTGAITLSLPQDIATTSSPTFNGMTLAGTLSANGNVTLGDNSADTVRFNGTVSNFTANSFLALEGATADGNETTLEVTDPTADNVITIPDNSGTVVVAATGPLSIAADGTISCPTCLTISTAGVTSLNGLTGALTIANASASGSTITIDDATTSTKGIASFNTNNFSVASGAVSIKTGGVTTTEILDGTIANADLENNSITINTAGPLGGGGTVALGGSLNLTCTTCITDTTTLFTLSASAGSNSTITSGDIVTIAAGTGISTTGNGTGGVTITNTGVTSNVAGPGISVSGSTGAVTITNTGVTSIAGTTNQIIASASTGAVTLSLPQDIHTGATPEFAGATLTDALTGTSADFSSSVSAVQSGNTSTDTAFYARRNTDTGSAGYLIQTQNASQDMNLFVVDINGLITTESVDSSSIIDGSVANADLENDSITINTAGPLGGGGTVALGGSLNLTCSTCVTSSTTLFTLAASSGSDSTIAAGDTVTVAAGTGISTTNNGSGTVTIDNTGVTSNAAGPGISVSGSTGAVTITNTGVLSITGTANQVTASASTGAVTLSLPQNIHTGATPTFLSLNLTDTLTFEGTTADANETTVTVADPTADNSIIIPDNSGTVVVAASGPLSIATDGTISCPTCLTSGGGAYVTSLNGLQGVLSIANASASGSTITIDDAAADDTTKGIATFAAANFADNGAGLISIKTGGVTTTEILDGTIANADLENNSITINTAGPLGGGGTVALGGSLNLTCTTCITDTTTLFTLAANSGSDSTIAAGNTVTIAAGSGISTTGDGSGTVTIANTGVLSITGTANQVTASASTGAITLSLPQDIHTGATPEFAGATLTDALTGTSADFSSSVSAVQSGNSSTDTALYLKRNTDTGPAGYLLRAQNAAANTNLFAVDINGLITTASVNSDAIVDGSVANGDLENSSITINTAGPLGGGGTVALGGSLNLTCTTCITDTTTLFTLAASSGSDSTIAAGDTVTVAAGTGISTTNDGSGTVTIANTGVTSNVAGNGINVSGSTGAVTITNTGVLSITGTANQVTASASTGAVTLSLPQDIHTGATPTFLSLNLTDTITFEGATSDANETTVTIADPTADNSIIIPDNSGTVVVAATSPLSIATDGTISCATCLTSGGGGFVTSLNGLTGALTIANASGVGSTITIDDATTSAKGIASFNTNNFSVASGAVSIKTGGVTTTEILDGTVSNTDLANSTITINNGTGISVSGSPVALGGSITITNSGVTSITGTANQVTASASTGAITLSLPQDIHTGATPEFAGATLTAALTGTSASFSSSVSAVQSGNTSTDYALYLQRNTDTSAAGYLIQAQNAAGNVNLFAVDINGLITTASVNSASIVNGSVANGDLENSSITINTAGPLGGGGTVALGGSLNLTCSTCVTSSTTLFTLAASTGSDSTIAAGDTVTVAAGTGISTTGDGSGTVTIANTGVTSNIAGPGISVDNSTGAVTITNTGVTSIAGTTNQIIASASTGAVTLSLPQDIDTAADVAFASLSLTPSTAAALTLNQYGTSAGQTAELRFMEGGASSTQYVGFKAPDSLSSNAVYTLPNHDTSAPSGDYVLTWQSGNVLEWKNVTGVGGAGDITDVLAGSGLTGGGSSGSVTLNIGAGDGITVGTNDISIDTTTSGTTATTSSNSGLEATANGLRLLGGCSDNEILAWNSGTSVWACSSITGAGAGDITSIGDVNSGSAFNGTQGNTLQFEGTTADAFEIALTGEDPTSDETITLPAYSGTLLLTQPFVNGSSTAQIASANSGSVIFINETGSGTPNLIQMQVGGADTFVVDNNGLITSTSVDSSSIVDGSVANADLDNDSVTINTAGPLGGGGTVALGGSLNLTCTTCITDTTTLFTLAASTGSNSTITSGNTVTIAAGTGISTTGDGSGTITIANTGVTSIAGTTNQIIASGSTGAVTLSLPQNIHTGATPTFLSLNLTDTITFEGATSDANETTLEVTDPTADNVITIPDNSGTVVVAATSPLSIAADGTISCSTCVTAAGVTSLNGLTGALTIANASGVGSTITIDDATTSAKGIASFSSSNFSVSSGAVSIKTGGVTTTEILDGTIANADISNSAAIAYSKLDLTGSVQNTDLVNSSITFAGDSGSGAISLGGTLTVAGAGIATTSYAGGTITVTATEADTLADVTARGNTSSDGIELTQNGNTSTSYALNIIRNTDTSPAGYLIRAQNAAENANLFAVEASGLITTASVNSASVVDGSVANADLQNSSITINTAGPLAGGGSVSLGGSLSLTCATCVTDSTTLFTLTASSGSNSTITSGDTVTIAAGTGVSTTNNGSGTVTIANTGVTSNVAGTGISVNNATGTVTITNTGVTSIAGTTNQITASASTGSVTLSLPQNIHTGATPTFLSLNLTDTLTFEGTTADANETTVTVADPTADNSIIIPDNSGTVVVAATSPLSIAADGTISCSTCVTATGVTSLNGLTGALTIANASGSGSTITIDDATTSAKGIASFNSSNFSVASGAVSIKTGGVTTTEILDGTIANADISNSAAIAYSKLNLAASVQNTDLVNSSITFAGDTGSGSVALGGTLTVAGAGIATTSYAGGTITVTATEADTLADVTARGNTSSDGIELTQNGNSSTSFAIYLQRNTDTSPEGYLLRAQNAAANANLFAVDVNGLITTASVNSDSIVDGSVANSDLDNDSITINTAGPLGGGGTVALGGSLNLTCTTCITDTTTLFTLAANSGSDSTIAAGDTVTIAAGTGISTTNDGSGTVTIDNAGVTSLNSATGALTLANSSESGGTITIDNASTSAKGIASFSSSNFSVSSGAVSIANDGITLGTHTTGNYIATISGSSQIGVSGSGSETAAVTLSLQANSVDAGHLAGTLTFGSSDYIDLSAITHGTTALQGLRLPNTGATPSNPTSGEGFIAYDATNNSLIYYDGSAWQTVSNTTTGGGDITEVTAGDGLTGGGTSGAVTLNIGGSSTITVGSDDISVSADSIGDTELAFNTGQHLTTTSDVEFNSLTLGSALSVSNGGTGATSLTGLLLGNGTSAVTGVTTSAGIAGAISDETGSGSLVFATSPTLVTPNIGAATATSINGLTLTAAADGFTVAGGTSSRTLTVSGANVALNQNLRTADSPTFAGLTVSGLSANSAVYTDGSKNLTSTAPTSGTLGFWTRTGTTLSPATAGDDIVLTDNDIIGLGTSAGRIEFDDQSVDEINFLSARVGIGTSTPDYTLSVGTSGFENYQSGISAGDSLKVVSDNLGAGFAVQNTNASGFSGVEYIDNSGSVAVFTGYNNGSPGEFRFNNISSGGWITFKIAGSDSLTIANSGNVGVGGDTSPDSLFSVGSSSQFQVNSSGAIAAATGITSSGTINFSSLSASAGVYTDGSKNLTSTAPTSGTLGFWTRTGSSLAPSNSGDAITTSGNISTSGSGTLTVAGATNLNGNTTVGDASTDTITFTGRVASNILPTTDDTYDLGDNTHRWANLFLGGETMHIGTSTTDEGVLSYTTSSNTLLLDNVGTSGAINFGNGTTNPTYLFNGDGTFDTSTGANNLNGDTTVANAKNFVAGQTTGKIGFGGTVSGSDYLFNITGDNTQDWSRLINISQANNAGEDSIVFNIDNTTTGPSIGSVANISSNLTPTINRATGDFSATNISAVLSAENVTLTGSDDLTSFYSGYFTLDASPTFDNDSGSYDDFDGAGISAHVSGSPDLVSMPSLFANYQTSAIQAFNTASSAGHNDLIANAYGIQALTTGNLTTTGSTTHYAGYFSAGGTADTNYGLYTTASGATTNYALYSASGLNYFSGNVGIGDTSPAAALTVGSGDAFQVNSSGAIASATGIASSGTIAFSGLSTNGVVYTTGGTGTLASEANLSVSRGGTGAGTVGSAGSVAYSNGSAYAFTSVGSSNQCLVSNGSSAPSWTSCTNASNSPLQASAGIITKVTSTDKLNITADEAADYAALFDTSIANTVDLVQITNSGFATVNDGVDGLSIAFENGNGTNNSNAALRIAATSGGGVGDALQGIRIDSITATAQTETALMVGSNWDVVLDSANLDISGAGAITGATGISSSGTIAFSGLSTNGVVYTSGGTGTLNSEANLAISRGGTNGSATPTAGAVAYGTGTAYAFTAAGSNGDCLLSNGTGTPTWGTCSTVDADSLDYAEFEDTMDLDADLTLNQSSFTWTQNFTGTTTNGFTYNADSATTGSAWNLSADSLTTGKAIDITSTSSTLTSADIFNITANGTYTTAQTVSGSLAELSRSLTINAAATTLTVSGPVAKIADNCTVTSGACTSTASVLEVLQSYTSNTGSALMVTSAGDTSGFVFRANDDGTTTDSTPFVITNTGNVGIADSSPTALLTVGSGDLFQVNSSGAIAATTGYTQASGAFAFSGGGNFSVDSAALDISTGGAITGATGITSSGTITFSGLTATRALFTTTGGQLTVSGTSAALAASLSDETGSGSVVFSASPTLTGTTTMAGISFSVANPSITASSYTTFSGGIYASAGTSYFQTATNFRGGIQNDSGDLSLNDNVGITGNLGVGTSGQPSRLYVANSDTNANMISSSTNPSYATSQFMMFNSRGNNVAYAFIDAYSSGGGDREFYVRGDGAAFADGGWNGAPDFAEWTKVTGNPNSYKIGDIVAVDPNNPRAMKKGVASDNNKLAGAIAYKPGFVGVSAALFDDLTDTSSTKSDEQMQSDYNARKMTVTGYTPVRVSNENGTLKPGDSITLSSIPGVGKKATTPGMMVGRTMDAFPGVTPAENQDTPIDLEGTPCPENPQYTCGVVYTYVTISYADPNNALANLLIDTNGDLLTPGLKTDKLTVTADANIAGTVTAGDYAIDPSKFVQTGALASLPQTNGKVSLADAINAINEVQQTQSDRLALIENQTASQSAMLADQSLKLENTEIKTADLETKVTEQKSALDLFREQIEAQIADLSGSGESAENDPVLTAPDELIATGSAQLAEFTAKTISGNTVNISESLTSLGETRLATTTIAGDLSVDGTFSITAGNEINVIGSDLEEGNDGILYIQKNVLARAVDFFNGLVTIDNKGSIIAPTVTVAEFKVVANKISGSATIKAGEKSVVIDNPLVKQNARILVTPTTNNNVVLAVTEKKDGESFTVSSAFESNTDISFDWWMVQEVDEE